MTPVFNFSVDRNCAFSTVFCRYFHGYFNELDNYIHVTTPPVTRHRCTGLTLSPVQFILTVKELISILTPSFFIGKF